MGEEAAPRMDEDKLDFEGPDAEEVSMFLYQYFLQLALIILSVARSASWNAASVSSWASRTLTSGRTMWSGIGDWPAWLQTSRWGRCQTFTSTLLFRLSALVRTASSAPRMTTCMRGWASWECTSLKFTASSRTHTGEIFKLDCWQIHIQEMQHL